jgi:mannose-6-phosphate isomerase-like protein (cupin superfamily)
MKTVYSEINPYITRDGSEIRELMHPEQHGSRNQSFAEARVPAGGNTLLHLHHNSEEIYHITAGEGWMTLGDEAFAIALGDTICIAPCTPHCVENRGEETLVILCCCAPPYSHDDTELM